MLYGILKVSLINPSEYLADIEVALPPRRCKEPKFEVRYRNSHDLDFFHKDRPGTETRETFRLPGWPKHLILKGFLHFEHIAIELKVDCVERVDRYYGWVHTGYGRK